VKELLDDPSTTSARLVVTPERMVVAEARRLATSLALFGYRVDAVIANRVVPDDADGTFIAGLRSAQAEPMLAIEEGFAPIPILHTPLRADEPVGIVRLREVAAAMYGELDPAAHLLDGPVLTITADGDDRLLRLELPFAAREDLRLARRPGS
jgi:arsenite/tail-anchored protein-transporting ATPase